MFDEHLENSLNFVHISLHQFINNINYINFEVARLGMKFNT